MTLLGLAQYVLECPASSLLLPEVGACQKKRAECQADVPQHGAQGQLLLEAGAF